MDWKWNDMFRKKNDFDTIKQLSKEINIWPVFLVLTSDIVNILLAYRFINLQGIKLIGREIKHAYCANVESYNFP